MPLPWHDDDDHEHIIRVAADKLRSTAWWRSLGLDAVVLYSWGDPRDTLIARAIHRAGIKLILQLDFNGHFLPCTKFPRFLREWAVNTLRSKHLSYADIIAASPIAKHSTELLIAHSDMVSFVDSLAAPLSSVNAVLAAVVRKKQGEFSERLRELEEIWDKYDVYDKN